MSLQQTKERGFTIVELLIVIVVIAILAAISIVAYSGITNRAKTSSGQQLAAQVEGKAQAFYTVKGQYPFNQAAFADADAPEAALEGPVTFVAADITSTTADGGKAVAFKACNAAAAATGQADTTGIVIQYWDYTTGAFVERILGNATC